MKAIHNFIGSLENKWIVVLYLKDTEKWKQFTTCSRICNCRSRLCCISKIQKNESNSQLNINAFNAVNCCVVSQRYRKMKAIHNNCRRRCNRNTVVLYLKDTEKWKQFTTGNKSKHIRQWLCCISKIQKNESNSQPRDLPPVKIKRCVVSQRYRKMKAIHNRELWL